MIDYETLLISFKKILKDNGLKFTKQRDIILKTLYSNSGHFTPEELLLIIKKSYPDIKIGIATIYRTLSLLEESKIVDSISFGAKGKKYEIGVKEHHDHLLCIKCGKIIEFLDETIELQQEIIAKKFNFEMTGHNMNIIGICNECQNKKI
ncbi:Ferric uptake regulation protein FUR [hydrothermal vent metagenome]|uniref:Ferric uptake regulation protein FUR n=1 Tax=hydrothermal vent metagenome TaxID=652676 RepID=A0A1W1C822_9ZZZZ